MIRRVTQIHSKSINSNQFEKDKFTYDLYTEHQHHIYEHYYTKFKTKRTVSINSEHIKCIDYYQDIETTTRPKKQKTLSGHKWSFNTTRQSCISKVC